MYAARIQRFHTECKVAQTTGWQQIHPLPGCTVPELEAMEAAEKARLKANSAPKRSKSAQSSAEQKEDSPTAIQDAPPTALGAESLKRQQRYVKYYEVEQTFSVVVSALKVISCVMVLCSERYVLPASTSPGQTTRSSSTKSLILIT